MINYKNKLISMIIILLLMLLIIGGSNIAYGEEELDVNVNIGFNGFYKYNYNIPVRIEIKNNLEDINGKVQLLFDEGGIDKPLYIAYTKELNIAKGTNKVIDMSILLESSVSSAKLRILDNKDKLVYEEKVEIYSGKSENTLGIGVLSNDIDSLRYLTLVNYFTQNNNVDSAKSYIAELDDFMLEKADYLNSLNILVINNYDTEKLNSSHIDSIESWVSKGGVMIVGTGLSYNRTLKGLSDIVDMNVQQTSYLDNFNKVLSNSNEVFDTSQTLPIAIGEFNTGKNLLTYDGNVLVNELQYGSGRIITTAFDLGLSPFVEWRGKYDLISELLYGKILLNNESTLNNRSLFNNYRFTSNMQAIPNSKLPKLEIGFIILGVFLLFVGPINYIVLKRLDKREIAWVTIPAITVFFTLVMYFWGIGASFKDPLMNNISIISLDSITKNVDINTISGVIGFSKGDIDVTTDENVAFRVSSRYRNNINYSSFQKDDVILEYDLRTNTHIIFKERGIWDTQTVVLNETKEMEGDLVQELTFNDSMLEGSIKNDTSIDLEDAFIIYGQNVKKLGNINKGQLKDININFNDNSANPTSKAREKDYYLIIDSLYPWSNYNVNSNQDTLDSRAKRDILEGYFFDDFARQINSNIVLYAWSSEPITSDISINGKIPERIDRNLIVIPIHYSYQSGDLVKIPYGVMQAGVEETSGLNVEIPNMRYYGNGYVIFTIKSDDRIAWDKIDINITNGYPINDFNLSIFNFQTNEWEEYSSASITIDNNNRNQYYNELLGTRIKVKSINNTQIEAPTFSIEGVAK